MQLINYFIKQNKTVIVMANTILMLLRIRDLLIKCDIIAEDRVLSFTGKTSYPERLNVLAKLSK